MNIEVFVNKLSKISTTFNNDLSEISILNDLELLLLSIIFDQINALNLNLYTFLSHIQNKLNKINVKVLIDLKVNQIYVSLMIMNQKLIDNQYEIKSLKIILLNKQII